MGEYSKEEVINGLQAEYAESAPCHCDYGVDSIYEICTGCLARAALEILEDPTTNTTQGCAVSA